MDGRRARAGRRQHRTEADSVGKPNGNAAQHGAYVCVPVRVCGMSA